MTEAAAWLIVGLPLAAFLVNGLVLRPFANARLPQLAGILSIVAVACSLALSAWALQSALGAADHEVEFARRLLVESGSLRLEVGLLIDALTAVMLIVVTSVSLMVQIYSQGYMEDDPGYVRYYALLSLFTASMLGLVLADNLIVMFVFWELVGLSSYLLIGFWYDRPAAAAAAKKAFIVTRFGDFGFLLAILFIFTETGTLDIAGVEDAIGNGVLAGAAITWIALGIFAGAIGKSAQFPLHIWLPDAMEGPTPVSALIHAATMVAAGVFLVARFFFIFEESQTAMTVVALVGAVTAIIAALMGVVMFDIKRVLAYSTISQLGFMMMALGVGAYGAAIFHLFNHAFFKALLFLGSGSVNHATGTFDMRRMGGLRRYMPWTTATFVIATLSISGVPPLSGFWSKDEILGEAFALGTTTGQIVFWAALIAAAMTGFYMLRATLMTFWGDYKGGEPSEHGSNEHPRESPWVMLFPMVLLAIASAVSWTINIPGSHAMSNFLGVHTGEFNPTIAGLAIGVSVVGLLAAYGGYQAGWYSPGGVARGLGPIYTFIARKYYMDELYENVFVKNILYRGIVTGLDYLDRNLIDRIVNNVGWVSRNVGNTIKLAQTGQAQAAAAGLTLGLIIIYVTFAFVGGG